MDLSWRRVLAACAILAVAGPLLGLILADLLPDRWWSEAFEHPRLQYALCGLVGGVLLPLTLRRRWAWAALAVPLWAVATMLPALGGSAQPGAWPVATLVSANVHSSNPDPAAAVRTLVGLDADIVVVLEPTEAWRPHLAPLRDAYPVHREMLREDNFGICIYARDGRITTWWPDDVQVPGLVLATDGLELLAVHPPPPFTPTYHEWWRAELGAIADWARGRPQAVVAGDLNATPWCGAYRRLLADGGLHQAGGLGAWHPTWMWPTPLAAPIDHVLVGRTLGFATRWVGPDIGSDHRPVVAVISR